MTLRPEQLKVPGEEQYEKELAQAPPDYKTAKDMQLLIRAIKQQKRWKIPDKIASQLPDAMGKIALGEVDEHDPDAVKPNMRQQIAAARVLTTMEGQNQSDEQIAVKAMLERIEDNGYQIEVVYEDRPRPEQKQIIDDSDEESDSTEDQPSETA